MGDLDWASLASVAVAVATLGLAVATYLMARETKRAADAAETEAAATRDALAVSEKALLAARDQAAIAQRGVDATIRPLIVDVPIGQTMRAAAFDPEVGEASRFEDAGTIRAHIASEGAIAIDVPFRNVGVGPAVIRTIGSRPPGTWEVSKGTVPPGETAMAAVALDRDADWPELASAIRAGDFSLLVVYSDVSGGQITTTRLDLTRSDPGWFVRQVFHSAQGDEENPFSGSGPATPRPLETARTADREQRRVEEARASLPDFHLSMTNAAEPAGDAAVIRTARIANHGGAPAYQVRVAISIGSTVHVNTSDYVDVPNDGRPVDVPIRVPRSFLDPGAGTDRLNGPVRLEVLDRAGNVLATADDA